MNVRNPLLLVYAAFQIADSIYFIHRKYQKT